MKIISRELLIILINQIIDVINLIDKSEYSNGSCGDGSFDCKVRESEHKDRRIAIEVLKRDFIANAFRTQVVYNKLGEIGKK